MSVLLLATTTTTFGFYLTGLFSRDNSWLVWISHRSSKEETMEIADAGVLQTGCWFVGGDDLTGALHDL